LAFLIFVLVLTNKFILSVCLASATNGKFVKLLGTTDLDSGTGLNQARAIKKNAERMEN